MLQRESMMKALFNELKRNGLMKKVIFRHYMSKDYDPETDRNVDIFIDYKLDVYLNSFSLKEVDGENVRQNDIRIKFSKNDLNIKPDLLDIVIWNGELYEIINIQSNFNMPVYIIQLRSPRGKDNG